MKFRQTDTPPVAAAKASFSPSTAYRVESDPRLRAPGDRDQAFRLIATSHSD